MWSHFEGLELRVFLPHILDLTINQCVLFKQIAWTQRGHTCWTTPPPPPIIIAPRIKIKVLITFFSKLFKFNRQASRVSAISCTWPCNPASRSRAQCAHRRRSELRPPWKKRSSLSLGARTLSFFFSIMLLF